MGWVQLSHEVRASAGDIFDCADSHENYPRFFDGFTKFEWTTPRHERGTRLKMEGKLAGIALPIEVETTEVVPDSRISGVFLSGLEGHLEWRFEPAEDTTWVTLQADYHLPPEILGRIEDHRVADRALFSLLERALTALKEEVEARSLATR